MTVLPNTQAALCCFHQEDPLSESPSDSTVLYRGTLVFLGCQNVCTMGEKSVLPFMLKTTRMFPKSNVSWVQKYYKVLLGVSCTLLFLPRAQTCHQWLRANHHPALAGCTLLTQQALLALAGFLLQDEKSLGRPFPPHTDLCQDIHWFPHKPRCFLNLAVNAG